MLLPKLGSAAEFIFAAQCEADGLTPHREFRFDPVRRFRFDFAWPEAMLGVELEGGIFNAGAHSRPLGILRDMAKSNLAVLSGWSVLRYTPAEVKSGVAIDQVKQFLKGRVKCPPQPTCPSRRTNEDPQWCELHRRFE